jgi:hypothetical protein
LNNSNSHTHFQRHSKATSTVSTSYHNIPIDLISSSQWIKVNVM